MVSPSRVMFEIYRDPEFQGRHHVIFFTELNDHNRDKEIPKAIRGINIFDGFLTGDHREEANEKIKDILRALDNGESMTADQIREHLVKYIES